MSLLELPPEILAHIFDHVGSSYFRSDLSRLTVCKLWSKFAHTACFQDFYVTPLVLRHLLSFPHVESSLSLVKDSLETLNLDLKGVEDRDSIPPSQLGSPALDAPIWTTGLNADLLNLANIIKQSRRLRLLRIQTTVELDPLFPFSQRRDYLFLSTIRAFLSADKLTSLELDLCGTQLISHLSQEHGEAFHICMSIAALLTTLRRLRLRMRSICADVLKPRQHSTSLRLNEVLINLSLSSESPLTNWAVHSTNCASYAGGIFGLKADMEEQAQVLVAQMAAPKTVRLLAQEAPSLELQALDVLTGKIVRLSEGAEWHDEGEAIEDEVSDESRIPELSSDG